MTLLHTKIYLLILSPWLLRPSFALWRLTSHVLIQRAMMIPLERILWHVIAILLNLRSLWSQNFTGKSILHLRVGLLILICLIVEHLNTWLLVPTLLCRLLLQQRAIRAGCWLSCVAWGCRRELDLQLLTVEGLGSRIASWVVAAHLWG